MHIECPELAGLGSVRFSSVRFGSVRSDSDMSGYRLGLGLGLRLVLRCLGLV